jgi:mannose-6-phosphate isomerase-like protein (cupin superfamily)
MKVLFILVLLIVALVFQVGKSPIDFWSDNIEKVTRDNNAWRKTLFTGRNLQVVVMNVPPGQSLGWESHSDNEQFFRVESGTGEIEVAGSKPKKVPVYDGMVAVIPTGLRHNVTNTGDTSLQFYTIYGPPHHPPGTLDLTHNDELERH